MKNYNSCFVTGIKFYTFSNFLKKAVFRSEERTSGLDLKLMNKEEFKLWTANMWSRASCKILKVTETIHC